MPNPNAIVSNVVRIEPPLDRTPPAQTLRAGRAISVELEGGRRVRLDPADRRSSVFAQVLDGLGRLKAPAYLEADPATSSITRLLVPYLTRTVGISPGEDGLEVDLEWSQARHQVRPGPDFEEWEKRLRESRETGGVLVVTEDDRHQIIDVRGFKPGPDTPPLPPFPRPPLVERPWPLRWLEDLWRWPPWPWPWPGRCISASRAQQVFDAMAATSCDPLTVPSPCIPFLYPDDGCWGRAHEMCRLMIQMGESPRKVWIQRVAPGYLHVNTRNNPNCFVEWGWHVAPTVCVRGQWWFSRSEMVIDPSMFTTPVTKAAWKAAQNNPGATLTDSDWSIFYLWGGVTDPTFAQTNQVLATYRLRLQLRSLGPAGPPPYANCP